MKFLYDEFYLYIVAIFSSLGYHSCSYPVRRNKIRRNIINFVICTIGKQKHYSYLKYFHKEELFDQYRCSCPQLIYQTLLPGINFENRHQYLRGDWLALKLNVFNYLLRYKIIPIDTKRLNLLKKDRDRIMINIRELLCQVIIDDPDFYRYLPEWLEDCLYIIPSYKPVSREDYTPLEHCLRQSLIKNYSMCCEIFQRGGDRAWTLNSLFYRLGLVDYFYLCKGDSFKEHLFPAPSANILLQIECQDFENITEINKTITQGLLYEVINIIRQQNQVLQ